jgi:hypothetical protein
MKLAAKYFLKKTVSTRKNERRIQDQLCGVDMKPIKVNDDDDSRVS